MSLPDPLEVTLRVARSLERLGVPYLVGGSLASSLHGLPRATNDADVVADLSEGMVDRFVADLSSDFYVDAAMIRDAVRRGSSFNVIHLPTMFKVDVFALRREPLPLEEMARRQKHRIAPGSADLVWFSSAEDTVLQKLTWYRKGREASERQWKDVLGVIKVQGASLDVDYLRRWAVLVGVLDLLERALAEALA